MHYFSTLLFFSLFIANVFNRSISIILNIWVLFLQTLYCHVLFQLTWKMVLKTIIPNFSINCCQSIYSPKIIFAMVITLTLSCWDFLWRYSSYFFTYSKYNCVIVLGVYNKSFNYHSYLSSKLYAFNKIGVQMNAL